MIYCELLKNGGAVFERQHQRMIVAPGGAVPYAVTLALGQGERMLFADAAEGRSWWEEKYPEHQPDVRLGHNQILCAKQIAQYFGLPKPNGKDLSVWHEFLPELPEHVTNQHIVERWTKHDCIPDEQQVNFAVQWMAQSTVNIDQCTVSMVCGYGIETVQREFKAATYAQLSAWQEATPELQKFWGYVDTACKVAHDTPDELTLDVGPGFKYQLTFKVCRMTQHVIALRITLPTGHEVWITGSENYPRVTRLIAEHLARSWLLEANYCRFCAIEAPNWLA